MCEGEEEGEEEEEEEEEEGEGEFHIIFLAFTHLCEGYVSKKLSITINSYFFEFFFLFFIFFSFTPKKTSNKQGNRPDFHLAMPPAKAEETYNDFLTCLKRHIHDANAVSCGQFGAMMSGWCL